jgi:hypothetical protein
MLSANKVIPPKQAKASSAVGYIQRIAELV